MQRSVRLSLGFLVLASLATSLSACNARVQANQNSTLSEIEIPAASAAPVGTIESDCEQLANLSMEAEVNAMGVQMSWQSSPANLPQNLQDLGRSISMIQALPLSHPQVNQLRNQYVTHLEALSKITQQESSTTQSTPQSALAQSTSAQAIDQQVKQISNLRRDRIFFKNCKK
jgi:hypothetical protein